MIFVNKLLTNIATKCGDIPMPPPETGLVYINGSVEQNLNVNLSKLKSSTFVIMNN